MCWLEIESYDLLAGGKYSCGIRSKERLRPAVIVESGADRGGWHPAPRLACVRALAGEQDPDRGRAVRCGSAWRSALPSSLVCSFPFVYLPLGILYVFEFHLGVLTQ